VEFLSRRTDTSGRGPKVLFATHYFELTDLEGKLPGVKNCNVAVREWQGDVVFLHKIVPGAADRSYGIHVARLAGLPRDVITRAYAILAELERKEAGVEKNASPGPQLDLFASSSPKFMIELDSIDINTLTPIEALQFTRPMEKRCFLGLPVHLRYKRFQ
jgi:DNA mismatch repair protein MutS